MAGIQKIVVNENMNYIPFKMHNRVWINPQHKKKNFFNSNKISLKKAEFLA